MLHLMWNDERRKELLCYLVLIAIAVGMIGLTYKTGYLYGSKIDWVSQHSVIPDYFRNLFYETGNLFPDFAMHLGAGQNIYYLSYYGFLNPVILISYLFPMVPMAAYISVTSILTVIVSVCLCFYWLRKHDFSRPVACVAALCLLLAGPVIFQSHRQLVFVNYLPFLFMGLLGVDRYFKTRRHGLLILGIFLLIMTSYFFSVGGIVVLLIYAGYQYYENKSVDVFKGFWRGMAPVVRDIVIAVMMSAVLWLPTLYIIIHSRGSVTNALPVWKLLLPNLYFAFSGLLYQTYALGLSVITLVALITLIFSKKRNEKVLTLILCVLLIFPIFAYILNGTLYARPKALIPFLPLYILITAIFLQKFFTFCEKKLKPFWHKTAVIALIAFILIPSGLICWYVNTGNQILTPDTLSNVIGQSDHTALLRILEKSGDEFEPVEEYREVHNEDKMALIKEIEERDDSFYRTNDLTNSNITCNQVYAAHYDQTSLYSSTYNKWYGKFYYDTIHNAIATRNRFDYASCQNIFFQNLMDIKYLITEIGDQVPVGYHKIDQKGDYVLWQNDNTLPFGFASNRIIDQKEFENKAFPDNLSDFFNGIIVAGDTQNQRTDDDSTTACFQKIDLTNQELIFENEKNVAIDDEDGKFQIDAKENASLTVPLNIDLKDQILIVRFTVSAQMNQKNLDTWITINGEKNKLSQKTAPYPNGNDHFTYILSANKSTTRLAVSFSAGKYAIGNFKVYTMPVSSIEAAAHQVDPFIVNAKNVSDNSIEGTVHVSADGYFSTTLPYDQGYRITVDGKSQQYEKVNTAFVGFPITKGEHHIVISFYAPYKKAGILITLIGFGLFAFTVVRDFRRRRCMMMKGDGGNLD